MTSTVKRVLYRFKVSGHSPFPVDMLRYDRCFPASEHDSGLITSTIRYEHEGSLTVELLTYQEKKYWHPQDGRWRSFGWEVHPVCEEVV